jgi:hypothetical protein
MTAHAGVGNAGGIRRLPWADWSRHQWGVAGLMLLVLGHWGEHVVQAIQLWVLDKPLPEARGILGMPFPQLVREEWLHYGYNLSMLAGLLLLLRGFDGRARQWWLAAIGIQVWHHFEHLILLIQAQTNNPWFGKDVPHSVVQLVLPRVELHLIYNGLATIPMLVAVAIYMQEHRERRGGGGAARPAEGAA